MIRIGILGNIGSGKSYVAKNFGHPIFNADHEVAKIYKEDKKIFVKLNKKLPKYIHTFPTHKSQIAKAILSNTNNLKKIIAIVHVEIKHKMNLFLKKNRNKKIVILDVPLLLENKLNKKGDILIFVQSKNSEIYKRLVKRKNFNKKLFNMFKKIQLPTNYKKKKSHFIIKNDFTKRTIRNNIKNILRKIYNERSSFRY